MSMFDINSPEALFFHVRNTMESYSSKKSKKVNELFFLIMALNHLREWIAPKYKKNKDGNWPLPKSNAERFSQEIYEQDEFNTLRGLCNGTKHLSGNRPDTSATYGLNIGDWDAIADVRSIEHGPPSGFNIDGTNIEELLKKVIALYADNWFDVVDK